MTRIIGASRAFGPLGLACLALVAAPLSAVRAQIVGPGVYAWGYNAKGQLGNGTTANSSTPVSVTGLSAVTVTKVTGGSNHSLAVTSAGAVYDWGYDGQGQLGNGTTANYSSTPVQVEGVNGIGFLANVTAVAGGEYHSLALTSTGAVYDWGLNVYGQLGNGTTTISSTPVQVTGGAFSGVSVTGVAGGGYHNLAVTSTGAVYAWGYNGYGELGNGTTTNSSTPVPVEGVNGTGFLANVTAVAGGDYHSLALTSSGGVYAWGYNFAGALGNGTTSNSSTPVPVEGVNGIGLLAAVTAIAAGGGHSLALTGTGAVYAWGDNNDGQLGNGTTTNALTALLVSFPSNGSAKVVSISAGEYSSFARESDGSLWAWGDNEYGQYGNGTTINSLTPIEVYSPTGGYGISAFAEAQSGVHSLAIVTAVPEPNSLGLMIGAAGLAGAWRLRRATRSARLE